MLQQCIIHEIYNISQSPVLFKYTSKTLKSRSFTHENLGENLYSFKETAFLCATWFLMIWNFSKIESFSFYWGKIFATAHFFTSKYFTEDGSLLRYFCETEVSNARRGSRIFNIFTFIYTIIIYVNFPCFFISLENKFL